jgi:hypothetical protein
METAIRHLYRHYFVSISLLGLLLLLLLFHLLPFWQDSQPVSITLERYLIMLTLIAIPSTLKWFATRLKKSPRPLMWEDASRRYRQLYFIRLYILTAVTLTHILLFGISRNLNFFWFSLVLFIIFLFCRPSIPEIESLLVEPGKKEEDKGKKTE